MNLHDIGSAAAAAHLTVLGGFHPAPDEALGATLLLLGPGAGFWPHFVQSPEFRDGAADSMDRWSARVVARIAEVTGGTALFPFGGPPHHPFISWATRTGRMWPSPVQLLVHSEQGLWVSFRGALLFETRIDLPPLAPNPCERCVEKPCLTACPVDALTASGYDVPSCKSYLAEGPACMTQGCAVRAACPVSRDHPRAPAQSAFHMRAFL